MTLDEPRECPRCHRMSDVFAGLDADPPQGVCYRCWVLAGPVPHDMTDAEIDVVVAPFEAYWRNRATPSQGGTDG